MDTLALRQPHARDALLRFDEAAHVYTLATAGGPVHFPVSVTGFLKSYFEQFDGPLVARRGIKRWRHDASSLYHGVIQASASDEAACEAIVKMWDEKGRAAAEAGTLMHLHCEMSCNGVDTPYTKEMRLFSSWRKDFEPDRKWIPERTEWRIWWEDASGAPVVAGTIDLLMRSERDDVYAIVDYKRRDPKKGLLGPGMAFRGRRAKGPLSDTEDSDYGKHGTQLNTYAHILEARYGLKIEELMLLQMHADMPKWHVCRVPRVDLAALFRGSPP